MYIVSGSLYARWWSETDLWFGGDINTTVATGTTYDATMIFDEGEYAFYVDGSFIGRC